MNEKKIFGDVLIVDDEIEIADILKSYCENLGIFGKIVFAHDGSLASDILKNQKFALILFDLKMPKKDGLDLIIELDDDSINFRRNVIVISASLDKTMIEKIQSLGVNNYLTKPFPEEDFKNMVLKSLS
jgi:response regulator of citrate/malate metabolism